MNSWRPATLGDCFTLITTRCGPSDVAPSIPYVGLEHLEPHNPRVESIGRADSVTSRVATFEPGDTLFGRLRPYLHKVALADFAGVCSPEILVLRPKTDIVLPDFLYLQASSGTAIDHAVALSAGSRMPRTSAADLASLPILLPSRAEQRRIADLIGALDAHIVALKEERDEVLLVRTTAISAHLADSESRISLAALADVSQGRALPRKRQGVQTGPVPWFKIADMTREGNEYGYSRAETCMSLEEIAAIKGRIVPLGSVVFPRVGAAVLTEKKRLLEVEGAVDENHLVLTPKPETDSEFLLALMEWLHLSHLVQTGAVPSLNMELIRQIEIPVVSPSRQRDLGHVLGALRTLARALDDEIGTARSLRRVLLAELFSGQVEIPESYDAVLAEAV